jgi:two-component system, chemotaxis family, protein-glutamate methylesterase/glutaminase
MLELHKRVRVLVVDDSAIVRDILTKRLGSHPDIEVVGSAMDPYIARNKLETQEVDVITLDIEMPRMDGLTFLKYLMKSMPIPVIIVSSLTTGENAASLEALELGAVDIVPKPGGPFSVEEVIDQLIPKILATKGMDRNRLVRAAETLKASGPAPKREKILSKIATTKSLVAVGASTGGTIALEQLFRGYSPDFPSTLAVIHMPERFTKSFANRLNDLCAVAVKEAEDREKVMPATIYIAPGNFHMQVESVGADRIIRIGTGPKVHSQRPAVDILFESAAENIGQNCMGILLTGMGKDGAKGLLRIKEAGGFTVAQDEESCIVFGMPKEAIALGAATEVLPLDKIAARIKRYIS